jgi:hypothetical protein
MPVSSQSNTAALGSPEPPRRYLALPADDNEFLRDGVESVRWGSDEVVQEEGGCSRHMPATSNAWSRSSRRWPSDGNSSWSLTCRSVSRVRDGLFDAAQVIRPRAAQPGAPCRAGCRPARFGFGLAPREFNGRVCGLLRLVGVANALRAEPRPRAPLIVPYALSSSRGSA